MRLVTHLKILDDANHSKSSGYGRTTAVSARNCLNTKPARRDHPNGLLYQIKTKNLIGDELSPRLRFSDTEIPLNQFLRLSTAYFVQDLL